MMFASSLVSLGDIANIVFVLILVYLLWLTSKKSKISAFAVLGLYVLMRVFMHFIDQSDNKYSDISHGLFGSWNAPLFGICLLLAVAIQLYMLLFRGEKSLGKKS